MSGSINTVLAFLPQTNKAEMSQITFTVLGDPVPYTTMTYRSKWTARARKAVKYQENVRMCALSATQRIPKPKKSTPVLIHTRCYFRNGRHGDTLNVNKICQDALWPHKAGGDKYTGGSYDPPMYDPDNPRVEITIRF